MKIIEEYRTSGYSLAKEVIKVFTLIAIDAIKDLSDLTGENYSKKVKDYIITAIGSPLDYNAETTVDSWLKAEISSSLFSAAKKFVFSVIDLAEEVSITEAIIASVSRKDIINICYNSAYSIHIKYDSDEPTRILALKEVEQICSELVKKLIREIKIEEMVYLISKNKDIGLSAEGAKNLIKDGGVIDLGFKSGVPLGIVILVGLYDELVADNTDFKGAAEIIACSKYLPAIKRDALALIVSSVVLETEKTIGQKENVLALIRRINDPIGGLTFKSAISWGNNQI